MLATTDRKPEIVDQIVRPVVAVAGQLETAAAGSVDELPGDVRSVAPDLDRSVAETIGEPGKAAATADEQVAAKAPPREAESAQVDEGMPRSLLRRRKQQHNPEEPPP